MTKRPFPIVQVTLDKIVGGGQSLGTLEDGRKLFVWGGLPVYLVGENVSPFHPISDVVHQFEDMSSGFLWRSSYVVAEP